MIFDSGKWQWHIMIEKMCNKLNYKPEEVLKLNYHFFLDYQSMWYLQDKKRNSNNG